MSSVDPIISRTIDQVALSTIKASIVVIESCETPQEAIIELRRWVKEIEEHQR